MGRVMQRSNYGYMDITGTQGMQGLEARLKRAAGLVSYICMRVYSGRPPLSEGGYRGWIQRGKEGE